MKARIALGVNDVDGRPVALMRDDWELRRAQSDNPTWKFNATAPIRG
jgi:predicted secreted hydrolase